MAFLAAAGALSTIGTIASAVSAIGQIQAGRAQARAYQAQAKQAELQGRQEAIRYKQQGVQVLRNIRQNLSTVNARAAAGGLDPFAGTPQSLQNFALSAGTEEFYMTRENALLAEATSLNQAQQYRQAASQARTQGFIGAISTIGTSAMAMQSIGGAPAAQFGGPAIPGQTMTAMPRGFGTMGASIPPSPAFPR